MKVCNSLLLPSRQRRLRPGRAWPFVITAACILQLTNVRAANPILDNGEGNPDTALRALLNPTQAGLADLIGTVCSSGTNAAEFQARCNAFVNFAKARRTSNDGQKWRAGYANGLQQIAPEQYISQGTVATRTSGNVIGSRLAALRLGVRGFNIAGFGPGGASELSLAAGRFGAGGSAGDENAPIWNRLGFFVNGLGSFGDVDNSTSQVGFGFRSAGITTGADYRFSERLIVGAAMTYLRMESDFNRNQGSLNSDAYSGSLYGTYYLPSGFYVDALGTIGGLNYDSVRSIAYTLRDQISGQIFDNVKANAVASPDGRQYVASLGLGFNRSVAGFNINPYLRGNYNRLEVGGFNEQGGAGMAVAFGNQRVESVSTVLGAQLSYAFSIAKGVLTPYLRGEWRHEFDDSARAIPVKFLGNTSSPNLSFATVTENPDRNYFDLGVGLAGTFAHGVSLFVNYDTLLGYRNITSHAFMAGARFEF